MCGPQVMAHVRAAMRRSGALAGSGETPMPSRVVRLGDRQATPDPGWFLPSRATIVDLTHTITPDFPLFPGGVPFCLITQETIAADGFFTSRLEIDEHTGTHLDAPAHVDPAGLTAELVPAERLVAPLAVIDISQKVATDDDAQVTTADLVAWEQSHGRLPWGSLVAMHSGWAARLAVPGAFLNTGSDGRYHFPGFHPEAARFLVEDRDIVGLGVDTLSLDFGPSPDFATHLAVLSAGCYGLESLANIDRVPPVGATVVVGSPKHLGGSGGPARVIALVPVSAP